MQEGTDCRRLKRDEARFRIRLTATYCLTILFN